MRESLVLGAHPSFFPFAVECLQGRLQQLDERYRLGTYWESGCRKSEEGGWCPEWKEVQATSRHSQIYQHRGLASDGSGKTEHTASQRCEYNETEGIKDGGGCNKINISSKFVILLCQHLFLLKLFYLFNLKLIIIIIFSSGTNSFFVLSVFLPSFLKPLPF